VLIWRKLKPPPNFKLTRLNNIKRKRRYLSRTKLPMKKLLSLFFTIILFSACEEQQLSNSEKLSNSLTGAEQSIPSTYREAPRPAGNSKIIKEGRKGLEVENLEEAKYFTDSLLNIFQAYYGEEKLERSSRSRSYQLLIRVPRQNFEKLVSAFDKGSGEIIYKEIESEDVGEEFVDLEARLKSKRAALDRYRQLLQRASNIEDILKVESKIRFIEEEIESKTGRLRYLQDQVDYSSLSLNIATKIKAPRPEKDSFGTKITDALGDGWSGFTALLIFLVRIWPFWLVIALILWFGPIILRRAKRKKNGKEN